MELPSKEILVKLYRDLLTARRVEAEIYSKQAESGGGSPAHRRVGEEVIPLAFCSNLRKADCFCAGIGAALYMFTKPGFTLVDIVAAGLRKAGKKNPYSSPENGSLGGLGGSGTLGEASVRYVGAAVAATIKETDDIVVYIQGEGAANRAPNHEAMAVAGAWHLPIIFVIQNNKYAVGTPVETSYNIEDLSLRGAGYGFPHERVDGNDMIAMYLVAKKHVERCRAGGGPSLIAADTWRLRGHFEGDAQIYRSKGEVEEWWKKEPLARYQKELMDLGVLTEEDVDRLEVEVRAEIQAAFEEVDKLPVRTGIFEEIEKTAIDGL